MKLLLLAIIPILVFATTANVYASGPRLDSGDDVTQEEHDYWVDDYDSGFAGKYDSDRANECADIPGDQYNRAFEVAFDICFDDNEVDKSGGDCEDAREDSN